MKNNTQCKALTFIDFSVTFNCLFQSNFSLLSFIYICMMKSIKISIVFFASIICFSACLAIEQKTQAPSLLRSNSVSRTQAEAIDEVFTFWKSTYGHLSTKSDNSPKIESIGVFSSCNTKSNREKMDSIAYIVNFEDNSGFAVVHINKRLTPIIALSDKGNLSLAKLMDPISTCKNEAERIIYTAIIQSALDTISFTDVDTKSPELIGQSENYWNDVSNLSPLILTKWGQDYPFNQYMDIVDATKLNDVYSRQRGRATAGCVMIALAQLMAKVKHPTEIQTSQGAVKTDSLDIVCRYDDYESYDYLTYDWSKTYELSADKTRRVDSIAMVIRSIADNISTTTTSERTGAHIYNAMNLANRLDSLYFSKPTIVPYDTLGNNLLSSGIIIDTLHMGKPIPISGYLNEGGMRGEGHAWLLDGYFIRYKYEGGVRKMERCAHFNWGFSGIYDGYYSDGILKLSDRLYRDALDRNNTIDRATFNNNLNLTTNIYLY